MKTEVLKIEVGDKLLCISGLSMGRHEFERGQSYEVSNIFDTWKKGRLVYINETYFSLDKYGEYEYFYIWDHFKKEE